MARTSVGNWGKEMHRRKKQVQRIEGVIGLLVKHEDVMMPRPVNTDRHEAEDRGEIRRSQIEETMPQVDGMRRTSGVRYLDLKYEQRDRDGELPIAESLDPPGVAFGAASVRWGMPVSIRPSLPPEASRQQTPSAALVGHASKRRCRLPLNHRRASQRKLALFAPCSTLPSM